jgi:phage recombination protein Bet
VSAVIEVEKSLPPAVARRSITEFQWRTLMNNLYPGASGESVLMVWDYCVARKLDPLKKPCHIVPMRVKVQNSDNYIWRDVVLPGIYEYRTTAHRTGQYLGHAIPVYGPEIEYLKVKAPAYCDFTVYRWNPEAKQRGEYPVRINFSEVVATSTDRKSGDLYVNARWTKAPMQMLTKCAEAAALREAFPDELGGVPTMEEMEGQIADEPLNRIDLGPRSDTSNVDTDLVVKWVGDIADVLNQDKEEWQIAADLREIDSRLNEFEELYEVVFDRLAKDGIIKKAAYRKYLKIEAPTE